MNPTRETSVTSPTEEPKYWVDVVPRVYPQAYSNDDYMGWNSRLMLGDSLIAEKQWSYEQADWIEDWARRKMDLDKAKRGLIESYRIELEGE